ncbi:unnamed protein product [marine sediment metagenome]|uniref:Uncharacterized protein n=1 Tax=marine sediment metagenome TaxID=412755 RepID=X0XBZ9_9ZZZZ
MIDGIDITLTVGRVIGWILGVLLFAWICRKIDKKIRGNSKDKDEKA